MITNASPDFSEQPHHAKGALKTNHKTTPAICTAEVVVSTTGPIKFSIRPAQDYYTGDYFIGDYFTGSTIAVNG
jgi:hypothetical protein